MENYPTELEEAEEEEKYSIIYNLNKRLFKVNIGLIKEILCEDCKEQEIGKLTEKCGNEEIARFIYDYKLNLMAEDYDIRIRFNEYIRWIPYDEFINVEYLAKGGFGEVYKATWINYYDGLDGKYKNHDVVLKRIYKSSDDKIVYILKEVK